VAVRIKLKSKRVAARRKPVRKPVQPTVARRSSDFLRIHFWAILGLLMMAILVHDLFGARGFLATQRQRQEKIKVEQEIQKLNEENQGLTDDVHRLKTDPATIERLAREQGLARPGEHVFKLPPKEEAKNSP